MKYFRVCAVLIFVLCAISPLRAELTILFIGDSLTEGYRVNPENSYPALVGKMLEEDLEKSVKVINAGVSGSTTSSGLSRVKWFERSKPDIVFLALGANDGLRGVPIPQTRNNLDAILKELETWDSKVILAGMIMPPNYGIKYRREFAAVFPEMAEKYSLPLMPFLLKGVAGEANLNLADGIHPNEEGYQVMAKNVYKIIRKAL